MGSERRAMGFLEMAGVLDDLPLIVTTVRRMRGLSLRDAAKESGVAFTTLSRIERGGDASMSSLRALLLWLDATKPAAASNAPNGTQMGSGAQCTGGMA